MRTGKMDDPPEMVAGIVMNVMTSCSLRPARRARNPPMAWMPSCELPAMRITTSLMAETFWATPDDGTLSIVSLMEPRIKRLTGLQRGFLTTEDESVRHRCFNTLSHPRRTCQFLMQSISLSLLVLYVKLKKPSCNAKVDD